MYTSDVVRNDFRKEKTANEITTRVFLSPRARFKRTRGHSKYYIIRTRHPSVIILHNVGMTIVIQKRTVEFNTIYVNYVNKC